MTLRAGTLAEAVRWHRDLGERFRYCLAGFLDEFYADMNSLGRKARIVEDPGYVGIERTDALVGAVAEHLCRRWSLGAPPAWAMAPKRFLRTPWFLGEEEMKGFYLAESPAAYRQRFIFTELEPLRRASMPKDAKWWYGEEIRTGWKSSDASDIRPAYDVAWAEPDGGSFPALGAFVDPPQLT
jgi:hypothetical protein